MRTRIVDRSMFYGADPETFRAAEILRKNMTLPEKILWKRLKDRKLFKVKFRRQHPVDIFIVDFYCHENKLVIEIDGEIHLDDNIKEHDSARTAELEKLGIAVIRFTNDQVMFQMDFVIRKINEKITELTPLQGDKSPRSR